MATKPTIHIAIGVVIDKQDNVLVALRPEHLEMGGMWEFPGGKVEKGETITDALLRELQEEVGIKAVSAHPLIQLHCDCVDKLLVLHAWEVDWYEGEAHGEEGQPIQWLRREELSQLTMLPRNKAIIQAVQLPELYLTTGVYTDKQDFKAKLQHALGLGIRLVQLRAKNLSNSQYRSLVKTALPVCRQFGAKVLLKGDAKLVTTLGADGLHLSSQQLQEFCQRPLPEDLLLAASCHNLEEIQKAQAISADFITLSPVLATSTHPNAAPLGWKKAAELIAKADIPVYTLGGMQSKHLPLAKHHGAQGIAAISCFWQQNEEKEIR